MIGLLIQCAVVFCGIYCILWAIAAFFGFFVPALKGYAYGPWGPNAVAGWFGFAVALTIYLVFGHHAL